MDTRRNAADLTDEQRDAFLEALIRLEQRRVPEAPVGFSVYDQFVALHGAIMAVRVPEQAETINMGHWNIGFCPWHREYLRRFERALQREVPGVTIPYWDWADDVASLRDLFSERFMGTLVRGEPAPVRAGFFAHDAPQGPERPGWWPPDAEGFRIAAPLRELRFSNAPDVERREATLHRGSTGESWPPTPAQMEALMRLDLEIPDVHPFWPFWLTLEQGSRIAPRTHNAGHRFIGGHMAGAFSPNDPIFWLHHANVDRLWAGWQNTILATRGGTHEDHYPPPDDIDPWSGDPIPPGHGLNDAMWPWVGDEPGYVSESVTPEIAALLPDYGQEPARRVRDVLSILDMDYEYA